MKKGAYYNENNPFAAQWLRNLIAGGRIAPGEVDERSIVDVRPEDLRGFKQVHLFAGIGGWSLALRNAGWGDEREVWSGSAPCQPFSAAGKGEGFADERHLWPHMHWLVSELQPAVVFGEQVASPDGLVWLDLVQADLEGTGYATAALDLCAAGIGAPHIRQRLYWVAERRATRAAKLLADAACERKRADQPGPDSGTQQFVVGAEPRCDSRDSGAVKRVANALHAEWRPLDQHGQHGRDGTHERRQETYGVAGARSKIHGLADAASTRSFSSAHGSVRSGEESAGSRDAEPERFSDAGGLGERSELTGESRLGDTGSQGLPVCECRTVERAGWRHEGGATEQPSGSLAAELVFGAGPGPVNGFWRDADWLFCRDGKWRPVKPGIKCLVDVVSKRLVKLRPGETAEEATTPSRVGLLKGYGNAIVVEQATSFIRAYMDLDP